MTVNTIATTTPKIGIFLLNLGTPEAPETGAVRRYLRQFLSDPRVIDISPLGRFLLVNLIIAPFRAPKSAAAYKLIWTENGSPLLHHGLKLTSQVQKSLEEKAPGEFVVKLGMRYGNPSIESVLKQFVDEGVDHLRVLPLYPQYASASYGSTIEEVYCIASKFWNTPELETIPVFYNRPDYINSLAEVARQTLNGREYDHYLFSYHGLPERHIIKSICSAKSPCMKEKTCCESITHSNRHCYRAQCYETTRLLAKELGLDKSEWSVCFQSRLGRDPWITPHTDKVIVELPAKGIKSLAIFSPAFVADCLETLEELNIRARQDFMGAGGEDFLFIPSLNTHPSWVETVTRMVQKEKSETIA